MKHRRRNKTWRAWTDAEKMLLRRRCAAGDTSEGIARELRRTKTAVDSMKDRLGIRKRFKMSSRDLPLVASLIKFRMAGWKLTDIAEVYNTDFYYVSKTLCESGFGGRWCVRPRKNPTYKIWNEIEVATLRKLLKKGASTREIQQAFPYRSPGSIKGKIYKLTCYYLPPEALVEREQLRKKQLRVY